MRVRARKGPIVATGLSDAAADPGAAGSGLRMEFMMFGWVRSVRMAPEGPGANLALSG
jgi:hypothetical protein